MQERRLEDLESPTCPVCQDFGWVQMTALNDFDEEETYLTLCRACQRAYHKDAS